MKRIKISFNAPVTLVLSQYVYEECFVKGNSLEEIMPDDPRTQEAITAVYMLYMDEQKTDESDEITS